MDSGVLLIVLLVYFALLMFISLKTSKGANSHTFYIANKQSKWYLVAFGMVGTSLSGVTFISVPGWVQSTQFSYLAMVIGYIVGYFAIAFILLPVYYKLKLPSIYSYLYDRFGTYSYKTGAIFFIISRTLGAAFRMFIVVKVLQIFVFDKLNISFSLTTLIFLILIILYTYRGGVKTLVYTDTLQTLGMILAVIITIYFILNELNISLIDAIREVHQNGYDKWFYIDDLSDKKHFLKQFLAGMFITLTMTGLDQEMMQKNLSCKNIKEARKNIITYSFIIAFVNLMFLFLGALLLIYAQSKGIILPEKTDDIYPVIALNYIGGFLSIIFLLGIISAAFPSADGALTSLTTIFSIDILEINKKFNDEQKLKKIRYFIHLCFALLLYFIVVLFSKINNEAVISELFTVAGYTYGPLLGLYAYGLLTKKALVDTLTPFVAVLSPVVCYLFNKYSVQLFGGYKFGFEIILLNGFLTFSLLALFALKYKTKKIT
jgi:Na+/proline symporter